MRVLFCFNVFLLRRRKNRSCRKNDWRWPIFNAYIYICVYMHSVALCETECVYRGVPPAYIDYARGDCLAWISYINSDRKGDRNFAVEPSSRGLPLPVVARSDAVTSRVTAARTFDLVTTAAAQLVLLFMTFFTVIAAAAATTSSCNYRQSLRSRRFVNREHGARI